MVLKDFDWEHDHNFELEVSGHNTWWKCSCARIASHPEVMAALVDAVERIRELEIELKVNVDALDEQTEKVRGMIGLLYYINQEVWTLIPLNKNIEFDFIEDEDFREFLETALSDKSNQSDKEDASDEG